MKSTKMITGRRKFDKRSIIMSLAALFLVLLCGIWATTQLAMNTTYNMTFASTKSEKAAIEAAKKARLDAAADIRKVNAAARAAREAAKKEPVSNPLNTVAASEVRDYQNGSARCTSNLSLQGGTMAVELGSGRPVSCCPEGKKANTGADGTIKCGI